MKNKIKIVIFDFDGTACNFNYGNFNSSWDAFSNVCGVNKELNQLLDNYYHHKEKEELMTKKGVKLFSGKSINLVNKLKPFPYSPGFVNFVNSRNGFFLGFLSSGLNVVIDEVAKELNLDFSISTELETKDGIITGNVKKIIPLWNKEKSFLELLKKYDFLPEQSCYVGDNENDISCFKTAGISVAYDPKTNDTKKAAKYVINNFKELNKILN